MDAECGVAGGVVFGVVGEWVVSVVECVRAVAEWVEKCCGVSGE